jgi:hypothetical protein
MSYYELKQHSTWFVEVFKTVVEENNIHVNSTLGL